MMIMMILLLLGFLSTPRFAHWACAGLGFGGRLSPSQLDERAEALLFYSCLNLTVQYGYSIHTRIHTRRRLGVDTRTSSE